MFQVLTHRSKSEKSSKWPSGKRWLLLEQKCSDKGFVFHHIRLVQLFCKGCPKEA